MPYDSSVPSCRHQQDMDQQAPWYCSYRAKVWPVKWYSKRLYCVNSTRQHALETTSNCGRKMKNIPTKQGFAVSYRELSVQWLALTAVPHEHRHQFSHPQCRAWSTPEEGNCHWFRGETGRQILENKDFSKNMQNHVELWDLQTRMCLQNLIQYGESIDQVAISQAQNHKSGWDLKSHISLSNKQYKTSYICVSRQLIRKITDAFSLVCLSRLFI